MARTPPKTRKHALDRIRNGESAADVARDMGLPASNVRKWVFREGVQQARNTERSVVTLVPSTDLAMMSPMELLAHDIRKARGQMDTCEQQGSLGAVPQLWQQIRKMQTELESLRASQAEDRAQTHEEKVAAMREICRVRSLCADIIEDRQARNMMRACIESWDG